MKGYRGFYVSELIGLMDMIGLLISNFTKSWQLEENFAIDINIFVFIISSTKYEKSIAKFLVIWSIFDIEENL